MQVKLYSSKWGEVAFASIPLQCDERLLLPGAKIQYAANPQRDYLILFQEFEAAGVKLRFCSFRSKAKDVFTLVTDPMITLRFGYSHSHQFNLSHLGKLVFHERSYNLLHIPPVSMDLHLEPEEHFDYLNIIPTGEYIRSFEKEFPQMLGVFLKKVDQNLPVKLNVYNQVASIEVMRWIDELTEYTKVKDKSAIDLNCILRQLTYTMLTEMLLHPARKGTKLSMADINKIYRVADVLNAAANDLTLEELADRYNMKPFKLKNGFKDIYGHSLSQHQYEEKMRLALRLIDDEQLSIKVIASMLDYSEPSSFIRAFKKRFGYTPGKNVQKR